MTTDTPPLAAAHALTEHPALVIDTETTGTDPAEARLVQLAAMAYDPRTRTCTPLVTCLVDPGPEVAIPEGASAVHGITRDTLAEGWCLPVADAIAHVATLLQVAAGGGRPVIAYNAPYDLGVLDAEAWRAGLDALAPTWVIDPLVLDRHVDRYRKGSRKLVDTATQYGVALGAEAHDATADARAAAHVARAILDDTPELQGLDAGELHQLQVAAHAAWQRSFNEYRARRGQPAISGGWPR